MARTGPNQTPIHDEPRLILLEPQSHMWGQSTQISSSLSPKRDCGSKGVNPICAEKFHRRCIGYRHFLHRHDGEAPAVTTM